MSCSQNLETICHMVKNEQGGAWLQLAGGRPKGLQQRACVGECQKLPQILST